MWWKAPESMIQEGEEARKDALRTKSSLPAMATDEVEVATPHKRAMNLRIESISSRVKLRDSGTMVETA